jgi:hypothetical protein
LETNGIEKIGSLGRKIKLGPHAILHAKKNQVQFRLKHKQLFKWYKNKVNIIIIIKIQNGQGLSIIKEIENIIASNIMFWLYETEKFYTSKMIIKKKEERKKRESKQHRTWFSIHVKNKNLIYFILSLSSPSSLPPYVCTYKSVRKIPIL